MAGDSKRRRLEGVIPDLLKRAVEIGVERASEMPDSIREFVHDRKIPKEVAQLLFTQLEDTKNGILRVVANEFREFLEQTNVAADLKKVLTSVQFEVNTTIRFTDPVRSEGAREERAEGAGDGEPETLPKPEVKTDVFVSKRESKRRNRE